MHRKLIKTAQKKNQWKKSYHVRTFLHAYVNVSLERTNLAQKEHKIMFDF